MLGKRNCLRFETAVGGIEPASPSIDSPALYRMTTAPHVGWGGVGRGGTTGSLRTVCQPKTGTDALVVVRDVSR